MRASDLHDEGRKRKRKEPFKKKKAKEPAMGVARTARNLLVPLKRESDKKPASKKKAKKKATKKAKKKGLISKLLGKD